MESVVQNTVLAMYYCAHIRNRFYTYQMRSFITIPKMYLLIIIFVWIDEKEFMQLLSFCPEYSSLNQ
jgi:hypothetical protein